MKKGTLFGYGIGMVAHGFTPCCLVAVLLLSGSAQAQQRDAVLPRKPYQPTEFQGLRVPPEYHPLQNPMVINTALHYPSMSPWLMTLPVEEGFRDKGLLLILVPSSSVLSQLNSSATFWSRRVRRGDWEQTSLPEGFTEAWGRKMFESELVGVPELGSNDSFWQYTYFRRNADGKVSELAECLPTKHGLQCQITTLMDGHPTVEVQYTVWPALWAKRSEVRAAIMALLHSWEPRP